MIPFATGVLEVAPATEIYWETSGVPDGIPLLYLHGGPGSRLVAGAIPGSLLEIIEGDGHGGPAMWERVRLALG